MTHVTSSGERRIVLILATIAAFITPFMAASLNVAIPVIGREFDLSSVSLGWIVNAYLLAAAVFLVPFGKIADFAGRKKIFGWGSMMFGLASAGVALSGSTVVFLAGRVCQGVGGAMVMSTSMAMLTSVYPPGERGRVLGINVSFTYLGLSLGPVLGGAMTQHLGWKSIFAAAAVLEFLVVFLVVLKLKGEEWTGERNAAFDYPGAIWMGAGLIALMLGFGRIPSADGFLFVIASVVLLLLFFAREKRCAAPLLDLKFFRGNPVFLYSNLAALVNYSATTAIGFVLSLYLQYIRGMTPQTAGLVLLAQPAMMVLFSPLAGRLSDRIEPRLLASSGMGILTAGLLVLAGWGAGAPPVFIVSVLLVLGFGFALFSSPNTNAVMGAVDKRSYGVASALLATMRLTGGMISMGLSTLVFALRIGRVSITPAVHPEFLSAFRITFILCAGLCLAGLFASLARGTVHDKAKDASSVDRGNNIR
ncbi:MAG: MFS transporter [Candidatus Aminicenantes bacterium]|nr:MFS transporter [Candidatus Aminicenantes bacterium]